MALPYPILNEGGALVVDTEKAAQVAWDSVQSNLDNANQLMKQRQAQTKQDYATLQDLTMRSSVHDDADINNMMTETRNWYAEEIGKGRNPNSARFISELGQKMLDIETLNGKAQASKDMWAKNDKVLSGLSGYWKNDEMRLAYMTEQSKPLAERNPDIMNSLLKDPQYYDFDEKMASMSSTYEDGLVNEVKGFDKTDGSHEDFAFTYNPSIHRIKQDPTTGKPIVVYEISPEAFSIEMEKDEGFRNHVNMKADAMKAQIEAKFNSIVSREAAGEVVPEDEQLTEWEEKFISPSVDNQRRGRMIVTQEMKQRVGFDMKEAKKELTAAERSAIEAEEYERKKQIDQKYDKTTAAEKTVQQTIEEQDNFYRNVIGENPQAALNNLVREKGDLGGVERNSFNVSTENGLMKVTYRTRSKNELGYKSILREKTVYLDPSDKGAIVNFGRELGSNSKWTEQISTGTSKLPAPTEVVVEREEFGPGEKPTKTGVSDDNMI